MRLAGFQVGDLARRQRRIFPPEVHRIHVDQLAQRTVRHRVPVLAADERRPHLHGLSVERGLGLRAPHGTSRRHIDALGPRDLDEFVRRQKLASRTFEHIKEPIAVGLHHDLARRAIDGEFGLPPLVDAVVVEWIARRHLIVPDHLAGLGLNGEDPFDYDGVNEWVQAELTIDGTPRKVVMQANRNGFLYVIERATGKLLAANKFVKVTWAERVDMTTGRPVWSAETKAALDGKTVQVWPSLVGGKNWHPMSYSPLSKLIYVNTMDFGWEYPPLPSSEVANLKPGEPHYGVKRPWAYLFDDPNGRGYLRAIDPLTGQSKWAVPFKSPN